MPGINDYGVFLAACILLNLTPGPDTLYIVGRTIAQGRRAGIASALGINAGSLIHAVVAALGLSAILATSVTAFTLLKFVGVAYLIYLGVSLLVNRDSAQGTVAAASNVSACMTFRQGILTNLTNPKVALFFLAFLPQFISPDSTSKTAAFLALGLTFVVTGTTWCLILVLLATKVRNRVAISSRSALWLTRAAGALFILLGVYLAVD